MKSLYPKWITAALLFSVAATPACDVIDEDHAIERSEDDLLADADADADADDQAMHDAIDPPDEFTEAPDPAAANGSCPSSASFCFWTQTEYGGVRTALPKGDFAINNFATSVKSMLKRNGTYRVKVFSMAGYKGSCSVFGLADKFAQSPNLPFAVKSARRMEPWEGGCSP